MQKVDWHDAPIWIGQNNARVRRMIYPGGEVAVDIASYSVMITDTPDEVWFDAVVRDSADLVTLLMAVDAFKRMNSDDHIALRLPYLPYARDDRTELYGGALSIAVMASLINGLGFRRVFVFDAHSDVSTALIHNCTSIPQSGFVRKIAGKLESAGVNIIVSPDAGAEKKAEKAAQVLGLPLTRAFKKRDPRTGEISGVGLVDPSEVAGRRCLIVDDICDGGGTFVGLAERLREAGAASVDLYVTHGLFSKGLDVFKGLIRRVYFTNSLRLDPTKDLADVITREI